MHIKLASYGPELHSGLCTFYPFGVTASNDVFNVDFVREKLAELENGNGRTYFEIVLEIFGEHPNIRLFPE